MTETYDDSPQAYYAVASSYCKANILFWMIAGVAFIVYTGKLLSLEALALFVPGIFVASVLAMLTWIPNLKIMDVVAHRPYGASAGNTIVYGLATLWKLFTTAVPMAGAIFYVKLITAAILFVSPATAENRYVEPPQAVEAFFRFYGASEQAMRDISLASQGSQDKELPQKVAQYIRQVVQLGKTVHIDDLNNIYPQWGDHFSREFLRGVELGLHCVEQGRKASCAASSEHLRTWDNWFRVHWDPMIMHLHEQYGFEIEPKQRNSEVL